MLSIIQNGLFKNYVFKQPILGIGKIDSEHTNRAKVTTLGYPKVYLCTPRDEVCA